jgi:hypothetical protein
VWQLARPFSALVLVIRGTSTIVGSINRIERGLVIALPDALLYPVEEVEDTEGSETDVEDVGEVEENGEPHPWDVELLDALFELVRGLRSKTGEFHQPEWTRDYLVPGEDEAVAGVRRASEQLATAQMSLDEAQRRLALREQRKILVTGTGAALETLVEEAFLALGFDVEEGRPGRSDRIVRLGQQPAVVEIKGLTKSAGEKDAAQLEKWVNEYYLEHSEMPKGILVVNAWRTTPLEKRKPTFPKQMLKYSESRNHSLISSVQLLGAVA